MKNFFLAFFILFVSFASAQEVDSTLIEDTVIVLQFDSLPKVSFFNGNSTDQTISRITSFYKHSHKEDIVFMLFLAYSVLLCIVFLNSRPIVSASFKTLFNLQFAIQFYRTEKQRNTLYYIIYLIFFIVSFSYIIQSAYNYFHDFKIAYLSVLLFTTLYFIIDYVSSYIYLLFTNKSKTIETVQTSILSFSIFLCVILWPLLSFIIIGKQYISLFVALFSIVIVVLFLLMRELRVVQILRNEKIDILSFHFFTYLCTFKFLPIFILVKIFLY